MTSARALDCSVVDVNTWIGADRLRYPRVGLEEVRATQQRYRIAHSLLRARSAVTIDRARGNADVTDLVGEPHISAVATATLLHLPELHNDLQTAVDAGAIGIWVEPGSWLDPSIAIEEMFRIAASFGLPLLTPCQRTGEASVIGALAQRYDAATVLVDARYPHFSDVLAAMRRFDKLHIETSSLGGYRAIELIAAEFGAQRVLFGSGSPAATPRSPLDTILWSDMADEDKVAILGGNARKLFSLAETISTRQESAFPDAVFDVHGHFFPAPLELVQTPGSFLTRRRELPIGSVVSSSLPAILGDLERGNEEAIRIAHEQPGQLVHLVANPDAPDIAVQHLRRWADDECVVGVKVHVEWSNLQTRSHRVAEIFDVLEPFQLPVLLHNCGEGWEDAVIEIAQQHPRVPIIIAHGGYHRPSPSSARIVANADNVYVELASSKADVRDAAQLVAAVPKERLLFGSDSPLIEPSFVLGLYQDLDLPDPTTVYRTNAERLFDRSLPSDDTSAAEKK